jgi:protein TonB
MEEKKTNLNEDIDNVTLKFDKKNPRLAMNRQTGLFFGLGLIVSMGLLYGAFEWQSAQSLSADAFKPVAPQDTTEIPIEEPPPTEQITPPPPPVQAPDIKEVPDVEKVTPPIETLNEDKPKDDQVKVVKAVEETSPKKVEIPVEVEDNTIFNPHELQEQANFPGGIKEFYKYVSENIKYPKMARRQGIEGKVFVQFVVEKDGRLTDLKVTKGIGSGCDEEAVRVLRECKPWNPAKQRGKAVRVKMSIPINFKLQ